MRGANDRGKLWKQYYRADTATGISSLVDITGTIPLHGNELLSDEAEV